MQSYLYSAERVVFTYLYTTLMPAEKMNYVSITDLVYMLRV
jgi:hypothetical protein